MTMERQETPTLTDIIRTAIEARLTDLHVMLPGEFTDYDVSTGKAKVKLSIKRKFEDGSIVELPVIANVPVQMPRTASSVIYVPIAAGDKCMVVFSERSLDAWKKFGGSQDPQDRRKHHLTDAVAIPGLYPFSDTPLIKEVDKNSIVLLNDKTKIRMKPDGKIQIKNTALPLGAELVKTTYDTLTDLIAEPFILNKGLFTQLQLQLFTMLDLEP